MLQRTWENYFIVRGRICSEFWKKYLEERKRKIFFIMGIGFDPRSIIGLETIINAGVKDINCLAIKIEEGPDSPSLELEEMIRVNYSKIERVLSPANLLTEPIKMFDNGRRVGPQEIIKLLNDSSKVNLADYSDIVVDASALPRCIFFLIITELLHIIDNNDMPINFHVIVAENSELDKEIKQEALDENAYPFPGFERATSAEYLEGIPKICIPILGENKEYHLRKICDNLKPEEVCPMLPFPAKNPRRCDDLIKEYYEFLFDSISVEPRNFIYAAENNPFDVYRKIIYTVQRYNKSLEPLGGSIKMIVSCLSSKIMTIGAAIAAYELRKNNYHVAVWHLDARGYSLSKDIKEKLEAVTEKSELFSIWLTGECYG
ncbi:MAG: hypothetical protein AYK19_22380 [Theionarchaea archaeon DG-70-1]|nr:MAG: hypothetical protein AYK19_22380 [Theionarchaea archaeon DG-70-1]